MTQPPVSAMHQQVHRFNTEIIGLEIPDTPTILPPERREYCVGHLQEELNEFKTSLDNEDLEGAIDALLDLTYVALGRLVEMGVAPGAAFEEVHAVNMAKKRGEVSKRPGSLGHDAIKPEGWQPPNLVPMLTLRRIEATLAARATHHPDKAKALQALTALWARREDVTEPESVDLEPTMAPEPTRLVGADRPKMVANSSGFMKADQGKACRPELIPAPATYWLGVLYARGAEKYAAENWRNGDSYQRYLGALDRHKLRFQMGHKYDDVPGGTGAPEMIAVAWNAISLFMLDEINPNADDRPDKGYAIPALMGETA
jgi:predicted HAD superfamily Cof-like phosphohydrolase